MSPKGDKVGHPSGESHPSVVSASCPQAQTVVEPLPGIGTIRGEKELFPEKNFTHTWKTTETGEKPSLMG